MKLLNCDAYKFKRFIKDKNLVCFGAGQELDNFLNIFDELIFEEDIIKVFDNDSEKRGKNLIFRGINIPIVSLEELKYEDNLVVLISCLDIAGVFEQLDLKSELKTVLCFSTAYIRSMTNELIESKRWYPERYRLTEKQKIPSEIHYCWFGSNPIPEKNKRCIDSWHKFCPDYKIFRWDESNYDISKNRYMYDAYKSGKWGFVSDYTRLDIIYECGGIYLDTDVEILKSLDDLLYQEAFVGVDFTKNINLGIGFGAKKNFKRMRELRDLYNNISFINEDNSLNLTTIPIIQKSYYSRMGYINNGEYQIIDSITIYPEKVLSAKCNITGRILPTKETFAIHHYDGSWASNDRLMRKKRNQELYYGVMEI